jgi:hypothetical protein
MLSSALQLQAPTVLTPVCAKSRSVDPPAICVCIYMSVCLSTLVVQFLLSRAMVIHLEKKYPHCTGQQDSAPPAQKPSHTVTVCVHSVRFNIISSVTPCSLLIEPSHCAILPSGWSVLSSRSLFLSCTERYAANKQEIWGFIIYKLNITILKTVEN